MNLNYKPKAIYQISGRWEGIDYWSNNLDDKKNEVKKQNDNYGSAVMVWKYDKINEYSKVKIVIIK